MKKFLSMLAIAAMVTSFVACDDDDDEGTPDAPSITAPAATNVQVETTADVTFAVTVPGGYKSVAVTATGGTAVKKSEPAAGATSGNVVVTYTADANAGAGTVVITVTDNNSKTAQQTGNLTKTAEPAPSVVRVSGRIETDQTWTADKIYELDGRVIVTSGHTLTIEPGTVIKGLEGTGSNASALMIARGAKIDAEGTPEKPIIMTSILDEIMPGEVVSPNYDQEDVSKWGGLVILGKAPISPKTGTEAQIEGVPASETLGLYGGDVADDNSGILKYVSIRHGGAVYAESSEINGLTLGGVGSGTTISDIEIFANSDDGVEFFGGTVSVSNILVSYQQDDGIDIDQAYAGTVSGFMVVHAGNTDEGLEIDGPEGSANAAGKFKLINGTLVGGGTSANLADLKSKAQGTLENILFKGYANSKTISIATAFNNTTECATASETYKNLVDGAFVFTNVQFSPYKVDVYAPSGNTCDTTGNDATAATLVTNGSTTGGPAISTWAWTASAKMSLLQ